MEEFNHLEQEKIRSLIPKGYKTSSSDNNTNKGIQKMKTKNRLWLIIVIVIQILVIIALIISYYSIKRQYSRLLSEEYDVNKEVFILRYKERSLTQELFNTKYEATNAEKENVALTEQITKTRAEIDKTKGEISGLEANMKVAIKEYNDRITLVNQLKEQQIYYKNVIMSLSVNHA